MKTKLTAFLFTALLSLSALACDSNKGLNGIDLTLQPGVPQVITWDFSDCWFGITSDQIFVTKPRANNGAQRDLSPSTPLTAHLVDLTTGVDYGTETSGWMFYCVNACQSVCGHVLQLTLTNTGSKAITVEVNQLANWGGPCQ